MSQSTAHGTPLRRNQGATSSSAAAGSLTSQQHRRRMDDSEANWMDAESSTEADTDDEDDEDEDDEEEEEEEGRGGVRRGDDDGDRFASASADEESQRISKKLQSGRSKLSSNSALSSTMSSSSTLYEAATVVEEAGADRSRAGGKPLISYVTNEWQKKDGYDEKQHPFYTVTQNYYKPRRRKRSPVLTYCDEIIESGTWAECLSITWRRATFKVLVVWTCVAFLIWTGGWWFGGGAQQVSSNNLVKTSVQLKLSGAMPRGPRGRVRGWFGTQSIPDFYGLHQVRRLNDSSGWKWENGKRLVIIGDVHGCAEPLEALLKKVKFHADRDHLAFTGDLVAKGPETPRVLDIAIAHNASCVRGNHDDRVIHYHRDLKSPLQAVETATDGTKATGKDGFTRERDLAMALTEGQIDYLKACPLILDLGELKGLAPHAVLVHAGLVPGLEWARQDPQLSMNMRSIDLRTHTPVKVHSPAVARDLRMRIGDQYRELPPPWDGKKSKVRVFDLDEKYVVPWRELWEEYQRALAQHDRTLVVYGHDSRVGVKDGPWAIGVDSGCVNGDSLSALVLEMKGGTVRKKIVSVPCTGIRKHEDEKDAKKEKKNKKKKKNSQNTG